MNIICPSFQWNRPVFLTGGTPLYKLYRCVPPHRVGFLRRLGLKTGMHFAHFGLDRIGYGFWGNCGSIWTYWSFQFQMSKKEREIWEFEMDLKNFFCVRSNLSNDNKISACGLGQKTGMDFRGLVWNGCGKLDFLVWNRFRNLEKGWHTPTKNSQEYPPGSFSQKFDFENTVSVSCSLSRWKWNNLSWG